MGTPITPMSPSEFQSTLNKYLDFHRVYLFRVMFFDGLMGAATGALVTSLISNTDTPVSVTGAINLGWMGSKLKIAGKTDFTDWKVTVRDDAINAAYTYFQDWRDKVYNFKTGASSRITTSIGSETGYQKSAIVILLSNNVFTTSGVAEDALSVLGTATTTRAYLLNGVWPKEMGTITLDYSSETIATFPVTFSVNSFEPYSLGTLVSNGISNLFKI